MEIKKTIEDIDKNKIEEHLMNYHHYAEVIDIKQDENKIIVIIKCDLEDNIFFDIEKDLNNNCVLIFKDLEEFNFKFKNYLNSRIFSEKAIEQCLEDSRKHFEKSLPENLANNVLNHYKEKMQKVFAQKLNYIQDFEYMEKNIETIDERIIEYFKNNKKIKKLLG